MRILRLSMFIGLIAAANCPGQTFTAAGRTGCWARLENDAFANQLTATIHGPRGTATRVFSGVDRSVSLAGSNDCRLAFSAELTADPILQVMEYRDGECLPCLFADVACGNPDNRTGGGWLPVHPYFFGWGAPYIWPVGPVYAPKWLQWDVDGNLLGDLHYFSQFPGQPAAERMHTYVWHIGRDTNTVSASSHR